MKYLKLVDVNNENDLGELIKHKGKVRYLCETAGNILFIATVNFVMREDAKSEHKINCAYGSLFVYHGDEVFYIHHLKEIYEIYNADLY